jgi:hypothetical protein
MHKKYIYFLHLEEISDQIISNKRFQKGQTATVSHMWLSCRSASALANTRAIENYADRIVATALP